MRLWVFIVAPIVGALITSVSPTGSSSTARARSATERMAGGSASNGHSRL